MEREKKTDMVVIQLFGEFGDIPVKFSVEPVDEGEVIDREYLNDLVEEAIMDAYGSGKSTLEEVGDSVAFALQNEGFLVRDFPLSVEELSFDAGKYQRRSLSSLEGEER